MITEIDQAGAEFRQRAETPAEANRLARAAEVLAAARHPGVVELIALEGGTLRLALLGAPAPDAVETHQFKVALATIVADLHDIGVVHGAVAAEHVLADETGAPVLCGWSHGGTGAGAGSPEVAGDVAALAGYLLAHTDDPAQRRALSRARSARQLALAAAASIPTAAPTPRAPRASLPVSAAVAVRVAVAVAILAVALVLRPRPSPGPGAAACPPVDQGCRPLPRPRGILTVGSGRYRIGRPGDMVVLGRWRCRTALPALLEPTTGRVWVFDDWAPRRGPQPARLVAQVPGAVSFRVDPGASGCDGLRVIRPQGATVAVQPDSHS